MNCSRIFSDPSQRGPSPLKLQSLHHPVRSPLKWVMAAAHTSVKHTTSILPSSVGFYEQFVPCSQLTAIISTTRGVGTSTAKASIHPTVEWDFLRFGNTQTARLLYAQTDQCRNRWLWCNSTITLDDAGLTLQVIIRGTWPPLCQHWMLISGCRPLNIQQRKVLALRSPGYNWALSIFEFPL